MSKELENQIKKLCHLVHKRAELMVFEEDQDMVIQPVDEVKGQIRFFTAKTFRMASRMTREHDLSEDEADKLADWIIEDI